MKILTVMPLAEGQTEQLRRLAQEVGAEIRFDRDPADDVLRETDVIVGNLAPERVKTAAKLKLLQLNSAGTDRYVGPGILPEGAMLANATGAYGLALSEHMLAMLLSLIKNLPAYGANQREGVWQDEGPVRSIWGSRTLVIGLGDIGGAFAKQMHALGSSVYGMRRSAIACPDYCEAVYTMDALDEQLALADYVACAMPGTPETKGLFDRARLGRMKRDAVFINVGRGSLVDPAVLAEALDSGLIGGACVDVTDPEPLPKDSPLWHAKNCIVTPHIAGDFHLEETRRRILAIASENIRAVAEGRDIRNRIL